MRNPNQFLKVVAMIAVLFTGYTANAQTIIYVNANASGSNSGTSWTDAYTSLETALATAHANAATAYEIRVAGGTYKPTNQHGGGARQESFVITRNNLKLIGGYNALTGERNRAANPVILSGDTGTTSNNADNCYNVMILSGVPADTTDSLIIDGFIVTGGNANGSGNRTINANQVGMNGGGGMFATVVGTNTIISNCIFSGNRASFGGGFYDVNSTLVITSSIFSDNAAVQYGGAMYNYISSPIIINNTSLPALFLVTQEYRNLL